MEYGAGALPLATLVCILISMVVSIGAPLALLAIVMSKKKCSTMPTWIGAAIFVVFSLILEQLCHIVFLKLDWAGSRAILGNGYAYATYGALAAGLFEETGRLIAFTVILRKKRDKTVPIMYGIGHGGIEAIIIGGVTMLSNFALANMLRQQGLEQVLSMYDASMAETLRGTMLTFYTTPSATFLVTGFERIFALLLQIALSVLVYYAVAGNKRKYLFVVAILIHAAVDFPAALYQYGIIKNIYMIEGWVMITTLATMYLAFRIMKGEKDNLPDTQNVL